MHTWACSLETNSPFTYKYRNAIFSPKSLLQVFLNRTAGSTVVLKGPHRDRGSAVLKHPTQQSLAQRPDSHWAAQPGEAQKGNKQKGRFHFTAFVAKGRVAFWLKWFLVSAAPLAASQALLPVEQGWLGGKCICSSTDAAYLWLVQFPSYLCWNRGLWTRNVPHSAAVSAWSSGRRRAKAAAFQASQLNQTVIVNWGPERGLLVQSPSHWMSPA